MCLGLCLGLCLEGDVSTGRVEGGNWNYFCYFLSYDAQTLSSVQILTFPFGPTGKLFWTSEPDERSGRALFWCQNSSICFRVGTLD